MVVFGLKPVTGDTFYIPGITNTCVYKGYVIDPGNNENVNWDDPGLRFDAALITHGHTDHFWNAIKLRDRGARIYAPRDERGSIENCEVNVNGVFCHAKPPSTMLPWFFTGVPCPVDGTVELLSDIPVRPVPMPGHTIWHTGYMTPDGVLYAGDAIVTKKVWDDKRLAFFCSIPMARRTLKEMIASDADWVLPSHGTLMKKEDADALVEINLKGIDTMEAAAREALKGEKTTEDMIEDTCRILDVRGDLAMHLIAESTVRSLLYTLHGAGEASFELRGHRFYWRLK